MNEKTNLELVKEKMPELVAGWNKMNKAGLLNQIAAEVLDLWAMQERVAAFMEELEKANKRVEDQNATLSRLEETAEWLRCLEGAGVDNWEGYDYALELFEQTKN